MSEIFSRAKKLAEQKALRQKDEIEKEVEATEIWLKNDLKKKEDNKKTAEKLVNELLNQLQPTLDEFIKRGFNVSIDHKSDDRMEPHKGSRYYSFLSYGEKRQEKAIHSTFDGPESGYDEYYDGVVSLHIEIGSETSHHTFLITFIPLRTEWQVDLHDNVVGQAVSLDIIVGLDKAIELWEKEILDFLVFEEELNL